MGYPTDPGGAGEGGRSPTMPGRVCITRRRGVGKRGRQVYEQKPVLPMLQNGSRQSTSLGTMSLASSLGRSQPAFSVPAQSARDARSTVTPNSTVSNRRIAPILRIASSRWSARSQEWAQPTAPSGPVPGATDELPFVGDRPLALPAPETCVSQLRTPPSGSPVPRCRCTVAAHRRYVTARVEN